MNFLKQLFALTMLNLRAIPRRPGIAIIAVVGVATTVAVFVTLLAIEAGARRMATTNISPHRMILLAGAAGAEFTGNISRSEIDAIAALPGIRRDAQGQLMIQPQAMTLVRVKAKGGSAITNVPFRGTGPEGWTMNSGIHVVSGRMYRPGFQELIVGSRAASQFDGLEAGDGLVLRGSRWTVTGRFEDGGGIAENSLLADTETMRGAFHRERYQSVIVELDDATTPAAFARSVADNRQLSIKAMSYRDFVSGQVVQLTAVLNFVAYFVGAIMAIGAVCACLTTMYTFVDARFKETATLRAIGFNGAAVLVSVLLESLALSIPGAAAGVLIAWALFNERAVSTQGVEFGLAVTPALILTGIVCSLAIGLIGGLGPSLRAARIPVAAAMRST